MPYRWALLTVVESKWRTWGRPYRLSIRGANQLIDEVAGAALLVCQVGRVDGIRDSLLAHVVVRPVMSVTASLLCAPSQAAATPAPAPSAVGSDLDLS